MPLVIPQDFAQVIYSLRFDTDPQLQAVTFGVGIDTGTPPTDATALAVTMSALFNTHLMPPMWSGITHVNTEVKWQNAATPAPPVIGATPSATAGGNSASTVLPQNSAFLVHKRTPYAGHRGRGRIYIPGVPEAAVDNVGNVGSATLSAWNTPLASFVAAVTAESTLTGLVVLHSTSIHSTTPAPYYITSLSMDPLLATQRRRLRP